MLAFFETVAHSMMRNYKMFMRNSNPALRVADHSIDRLTYVLGQYSILPREIMTLLSLAHTRAEKAGWLAVTRELERNLAEERGRDTDGHSHYEILVSGAKRDFGIDLGAVDGKDATRAFIERILTNLRNPDPRFALGTAYALEATAVPELRIVLELIQRLSLARQMGIGEELQDFFDRHLELWEPGHEAGLRLASTKYMKSEEDRHIFTHGFFLALYQMEAWWQGMANEAREL